MWNCTTADLYLDLYLKHILNHYSRAERDFNLQMLSRFWYTSAILQGLRLISATWVVLVGHGWLPAGAGQTVVAPRARDKPLAPAPLRCCLLACSDEALRCGMEAVDYCLLWQKTRPGRQPLSMCESRVTHSALTKKKAAGTLFLFF